MKQILQAVMRRIAAFLRPLGEDYDMEFVQDMYAPFQAQTAARALRERTFA